MSHGHTLEHESFWASAEQLRRLESMHNVRAAAHNGSCKRSGVTCVVLVLGWGILCPMGTPLSMRAFGASAEQLRRLESMHNVRAASTQDSSRKCSGVWRCARLGV